MFVKNVNLFALFAILFFSSCSNSQFKTLVGHWEGSMVSDGKTFGIAVDFSETESFFDVPQMGFFYQPFAKVEKTGNEVEFVVDEKENIIINTKLEGEKITGGIEGESDISVSLKRISLVPQLYLEEEVSYKSGDVILSGTLIYPNSLGPHPAIVFIHGSGKMTRETMRNRACLLVKKGFAALIYDRRGKGKSEGNPDRILPMQILANDALAGVEFLKKRNDIKKEQIGVYGLSQGGWVAPLCASESKDIAFIITISAPGITPDEQNEFVVQNMSRNRLKNILAESKVPGNVVEKIVNEVLSHQKDGMENSQNEKKEIVRGFSFFDPEPVWEKITIPVLAIWGENDELVPSIKSKMIVENALLKADNKDHTLKIFENANHSIKLTGEENKIAGKWEVMAPGSNELIVNWLIDRFIKN